MDLNENIKDRQLKIKDEYLKLMYVIAVDYDGCNTVESLKGLIDQLMDYTKRAIENDDNYEVYRSCDETKLNILCEKIK